MLFIVFLECPLYQIQRANLFNDIENFELNIETILFGNEDLSLQININEKGAHFYRPNQYIPNSSIELHFDMYMFMFMLFVAIIYM